MNTHCCAQHLAAVRQLASGYLMHRIVFPTGHTQINVECWTKLQCAECGQVDLVKWNLPGLFEPVPAAPVTWRGLFRQAWVKLFPARPSTLHPRLVLQ